MGIQISGGASHNTIGGSAGSANTIAFNSGPGISVRNTHSVGNQFEANAIYANDGLGIDLNSDGVSLNDSSDADTGPNNLQNFPVITQIVAGATTHVVGSLNSTASKTFIIDLYANMIADPSGYGEGEVWLTSFEVNTDETGNRSFDMTLPVATAGGQIITATATDKPTMPDPGGNTSEFSLAVETVQVLFGTQDNDHFLVEAGAAAGEIKVTRTNQQGTEVIHLKSSEISLIGLGGDDTFVVNGLPARNLHLDGGDQDDVFEIHATEGGSVTIVGLSGDDRVVVDAVSPAGATIDLGDGDDDYLVNFGNLQGVVVLNDSAVAGTDSLVVDGTNNPDVINKDASQITLGDPVVETIDYAGMENIQVSGRGGKDKINDPGTNTTLLGGSGDDTITINIGVDRPDCGHRR